LTKPIPPPVQPPIQPGNPPPIPPSDPPAPEPQPPSGTASELKSLYGESQVHGDALPSWLSQESRLQLLRVHRFGNKTEEWPSMLVVTPLFEALIHLDPGATIDLSSKLLKLPGLGKEFPLHVKPEHIES